jgi:uncharacterized DUF497 family protein
VPALISSIETKRYEWNAGKRKENLEKHGIDFTVASDFDWGLAIVHPDERFPYDEERLIAYGPLRERLYVLVFTRREDDVTRIISLRKANRREQAAYTAAILARLARG